MDKLALHRMARVQLILLLTYHQAAVISSLNGLSEFNGRLNG